MKKYSSGSFVDAALRVYGSEADTISSFPASIITNGGNITPWTINGNTSGGQSVGEKTDNLFDKSLTLDNYWLSSSTGTAAPQTGYFVSDYIIVIAGNTYNTENAGRTFCWYNSEKSFISSNTSTNQAVAPENAVYLRINAQISVKDTSFVYEGTTAKTFEPYGYKLPVVIGSTTTNIYMADVLRMSSGADPVYDVMNSTGTITRNVDTDGNPLPTPTTESFTAPTLATVAGSQSFTINTTVKPSSVSLTYTGWHTHSDKQYSGGQWGQVSTNAKKKKSVLGSRKASKGKT